MAYKECINQRTMTHKFDTAPLLTKLNESLQSGLQDLLRDFVANYELYEQTHFHLLQTPAIRGLAKGDNGNIISTQMQKIYELKAEVTALKAELNELKGSKKTQSDNIQTENIQIKIEDPEVVVEPGPVKRVYVNLLDEQPVVKKEPETLIEAISEAEDLVEDDEEGEEEADEEEEAPELVEEEAEEVDEEEVEEGEEADEGEAVEEVIIKGTRYYADNTTDGRIYAIIEDEEVGEEVGIYVNGKPKMYKK